ncbi:MAG: glutathione S-transferase family protein [Halomonas sp.]|nr:glutathione S-transferase family protein [Halomonas sp.]MCC5882787.1 glutathione S-transferase family protein [Halomonas sp.]
MKLVIGNKNYSSWSLRPWLLLRMHGLSFEEIRVPLAQSSTRETLAAHSDAGKVPVLRDDDILVWDSLAICEYISEAYLSGAGWPAARQERAEARSLSAEMHAGFVELRTRMPMNCRASGRRVEITETLAAEIERIDRIWAQCQERYEGRGPWLFGEFSIADCMFAPVAFRFASYGVKVSPRATAYQQTLLGAEPMQEWAEQAKAEPEVIESAEVGTP